MVSVQVARHISPVLPSLAHAAVLRAGQIIEVPGLGNGTSVCSDDSRMDDGGAPEWLQQSPRTLLLSQQRTASLVRIQAHIALDPDVGA